MWPPIWNRDFPTFSPKPTNTATPEPSNVVNVRFHMKILLIFNYFFERKINFWWWSSRWSLPSILVSGLMILLFRQFLLLQSVVLMSPGVFSLVGRNMSVKTHTWLVLSQWIPMLLSFFRKVLNVLNLLQHCFTGCCREEAPQNTIGNQWQSLINLWGFKVH